MLWELDNRRLHLSLQNGCVEPLALALRQSTSFSPGQGLWGPQGHSSENRGQSAWVEGVQWQLLSPLRSGGRAWPSLRVLHVLTPPVGLHHLLVLWPDVGLQRALPIAAVPRVVDDGGVPGGTRHT